MKIQYFFLILATTVMSSVAMTREAQELLAAYHSNDLEQLDAVVSRGISIDTPLFDDGSTVLMYAAFHGNAKIVQWTLSRGADVNSTTDRGRTPLYDAACKGHIECVQKLLDTGANPNIKKNDGTTALHQAVKLGYISCVQALLAAGANPNIQTNDGITPLHVALYTGYTACVPLLRAFGADPYKTDNFGHDAFWHAQALHMISLLKTSNTTSLFRFVKDRELGGLKGTKTFVSKPTKKRSADETLSSDAKRIC